MAEQEKDKGNQKKEKKRKGNGELLPKGIIHIIDQLNLNLY